MPCRDYDDSVRIVDNTRTYQAQRDKLARIACRAMTVLERLGRLHETELDREARDWFEKHKIDDAKVREEERLARVQKARADRELAEKIKQKELAQLATLQKKYGVKK